MPGQVPSGVKEASFLSYSNNKAAQQAALLFVNGAVANIYRSRLPDHAIGIKVDEISYARGVTNHHAVVNACTDRFLLQDAVTAQSCRCHFSSPCDSFYLSGAPDVATEIPCSPECRVLASEQPLCRNPVGFN
jgi:hypothetical protein